MAPARPRPRSRLRGNTGAHPQALTVPAIAKPAGTEGFAIVTCATPKHGPDFVAAKTWASTVDILQNTAALK